MAVIPQDRRGQILLLLTVVAVVAMYFTWAGLSVVGLKGYKPLGLRADSLRREINAINTQVGRAKRDVAQGALTQMEQRLGEFSAGLRLMRQLVPTTSEVPNLLDDIASRAKMRGATFAGFTPQALESGAPFDTQRYKLSVTGQYDQIAEFLTDVASLPRIVVPYDVHFQRIQGAAADTSASGASLQATFSVRTYVKLPASDTTAAGLAAGQGGDD